MPEPDAFPDIGPRKTYGATGRIFTIEIRWILFRRVSPRLTRAVARRQTSPVTGSRIRLYLIISVFAITSKFIAAISPFLGAFVRSAALASIRFDPTRLSGREGTTIDLDRRGAPSRAPISGVPGRGITATDCRGRYRKCRREAERCPLVRVGPRQRGTRNGEK